MRFIKHPILCNYYLTYRCNAACGFCDIWERPSEYASLEIIRENLRALKRLKVKVIDFTGGEPLLHRQIDQILSLAKEMGFITTLTTNCLLYPKWAERLKGKIDMLHFSLDSIVEEKHNASRKVACYAHIQESITIARSLKERPDILFTVFPENMHELPMLHEEYALKKDLVVILNPVFDYHDVDVSLNKTHLKTLKKWAKKKNVYLNEAFIQLRLDGGNKTKNPICRAGSSTIVISPDNKLIVPCYHLESRAFPINNDLDQLYKKQEVQNSIAQEGKLKECEGCVINCYMQPSFAVEFNKYWWHALPSTIKYNRLKGTWKSLF